MAENNANNVLDGENKVDETKTSPENLTTPGEQPGQTEPSTTEPPQTDAPPLDNPAPDISDNPPEAEKQAAEKETEKQTTEQGAGEKEADAPKRRGRQPSSFNPKVEHTTAKSEKEPPTDKTDKAEKTTKAEKSDSPDKPKRGGRPPKTDKTANVGGGVGGDNKTPQEKTAAMAKEAIDKHGGDTPAEPVTPPEPEPPRDANRINETETIVYIDHSELHPFKNHPFQVRDDDAMKTLVASVKERGVDQAAIVRPREGGGFEMVAGHRRQHASELAGIKNLPCIVRNMTDEEAILAMTESNFNQRSEMLVSERALALKMQLDAIKRQGERHNGTAAGDIGKRSNEIVAEKNNMSAKNVQRYIALNNLTPDLMKLVDDKAIKSFMVAFELSYIKPKMQEYIAMTIESQESAPSHAQAQRMRELDSKGILNGDVIDGIMLEEKKEEIKVIITGQELTKYFGADKSPKDMKNTILKLLEEHAAKNPPELGKTDKKKDAPEK